MKEEKYNRCPNCGKKGLFKADDCFFEDKTHRCKYCDMEYKLKIRKGEFVLEGDIPRFS